MANILTVRQRILENLIAILNNLKDPNTGVRVFNVVTRDNLLSVDVLQLPACGITDGPEKVDSNLYPLSQRCLTLFIEFVFEPQEGLDVYEKFNYYIGVLQATMFVDRTIGGLAYQMVEIHNQPQIIDRNDPRPGGILTIEIQYRSNQTDPYSPL